MIVEVFFFAPGDLKILGEGEALVFDPFLQTIELGMGFLMDDLFGEVDLAAFDDLGQDGVQVFALGFAETAVQRSRQFEVDLVVDDADTAVFFSVLLHDLQ